MQPVSRARVLLFFLLQQRRRVQVLEVLIASAVGKTHLLCGLPGTRHLDGYNADWGGCHGRCLIANLRRDGLSLASDQRASPGSANNEPRQDNHSPKQTGSHFQPIRKARVQLQLNKRVYKGHSGQRLSHYSYFCLVQIQHQLCARLSGQLHTGSQETDQDSSHNDCYQVL